MGWVWIRLVLWHPVVIARGSLRQPQLLLCGLHGIVDIFVHVLHVDMLLLFLERLVAVDLVDLVLDVVQSLARRAVVFEAAHLLQSIDR